MSFQSSLHAKYWLLSSEESLHAKRVRANRVPLGIENVEHIGDGRVTVDEETRLHHIMSEAVYNGVVAAYTTIPKYSLQGPFYTHAKHAAATAMMFYKMFFLEHSANEWDVWQIAFGSIYLASKTEECRLVEQNPKLDDFRPILNQYKNREVTLEEIEQAEMSVLGVVGKCLTVHHPFKAIKGLIIEAQKLTPDSGLDQYAAYCQSAIDAVGKALPYDVELLFVPSQIATVALYVSALAYPDCPVRANLLTFCANKAAEHSFDINAISSYFNRKQSKTDKAAARDIYAKVQAYWNHKSNLLQRIANPVTAMRDHIPGGGNFDRDANADAMDTTAV